LNEDLKYSAIHCDRSVLWRKTIHMMEFPNTPRRELCLELTTLA
jgi:hypothetical protein